ncbi:MAG: AraC family transcriptional regulator [Verrucomicrobiota bacterium]
MGLFFGKNVSGDNRIENVGRWPMRVTHFHLVDDYEFPATNFPEVFFVQDGTFLHESDGSTQALREGAVLVVNPGSRHRIRRPEGVTLSRIRFLPEWFTLEYELIANSPTLLSVFFDQSWFRYPREEGIHVFLLASERAPRVKGIFDDLWEMLKAGKHNDPALRVTLLSLLSRLAEDYDRYWRGVAEVERTAEAKYALDVVEKSIVSGQPFQSAKMPRAGFEKRKIRTAFEELTGMELDTYADRRRVFHAAVRLLLRDDEPRKISKDLGFTTTSEFSKRFEAIFDISPSVYREKFRPRRPADEPATAAEDA